MLVITKNTLHDYFKLSRKHFSRLTGAVLLKLVWFLMCLRLEQDFVFSLSRGWKMRCHRFLNVKWPMVITVAIIVEIGLAFVYFFYCWKINQSNRTKEIQRSNDNTSASLNDWMAQRRAHNEKSRDNFRIGSLNVYFERSFINCCWHFVFFIPMKQSIKSIS